ncbi:unnamed protein product [Vitrella brassicaformis CCMP3155]|uniref:VPS10 domain-containing protein n=1 Tax=Vitrella brassicaformis (strain CCMP3155) TaxID=1169540 RepID=A0A0G4FLG0_VITBC|nr:unnamed protein product [Vitrella brassicaformis CCMP3155]|eukprot:CEM14758.1 unnamed protein product [Vitrella brassicaformis CCMP3155]
MEQRGILVQAQAASQAAVRRGNVGYQLMKEVPGMIGVFVSHDGGQTWMQSLPGDWEVSILLGGDVLLASHKDGTIAFSRYSTDWGLNWHPVAMAEITRDATLWLHRVLASPPHTSAQVLVWTTGRPHTPWEPLDMVKGKGMAAVVGGQKQQLAFRPYLVAIDFDGVFDRECKCWDSIDLTASDFEDWPKEADRCHMGQTVYLVRRKPAAACRSGNHLAEAVSFTACKCTSEDFECDYGFERGRGSDGGQPPTCHPIDDSVYPDPTNATELCAHRGEPHAFVSKGFVRIPGDRCVGGEAWAPEKVICPANIGIAGILHRLERSHYLILAFLLVGVIVYFILKTSDKDRQLWRRLIASAASHASLFTSRHKLDTDEDTEYTLVDTRAPEDHHPRAASSRRVAYRQLQLQERSSAGRGDLDPREWLEEDEGEGRRARRPLRRPSRGENVFRLTSCLQDEFEQELDGMMRQETYA